jgi:hypothetical protein
MGVAKAARMNIETITETHCGSGVVAFDRFGHLLPKFWAQSATTRAIAEPTCREGLEISAAHGIRMLGSMCDLVDGRFIGRTVEAWVRTFADGEQIPIEGLGSIAETDPEVRTSIIAQGFDLLTMDTHTALATFDLDEHGQAMWIRTSDSSVPQQFRNLAWSVSARQLAPRPQPVRAAIEAFIADCGWRMIVSHA